MERNGGRFHGGWNGRTVSYHPYLTQWLGSECGNSTGSTGSFYQSPFQQHEPNGDAAQPGRSTTADDSDIKPELPIKQEPVDNDVEPASTTNATAPEIKVEVKTEEITAVKPEVNNEVQRENSQQRYYARSYRLLRRSNENHCNYSQLGRNVCRFLTTTFGRRLVPATDLTLMGPLELACALLAAYQLDLPFNDEQNNFVLTQFANLSFRSFRFEHVNIEQLISQQEYEHESSPWVQLPNLSWSHAERMERIMRDTDRQFSAQPRQRRRRRQHY